MKLSDFLRQSDQAAQMAAAEVRRVLHDYPDAQVLGGEVIIPTKGQEGREAVFEEFARNMGAYIPGIVSVQVVKGPKHFFKYQED